MCLPLVEFLTCLGFYTNNVIYISIQLEHLPSMVAGVWSDESTLQLEATTQFRKLLSIGEYKTISLRVCVHFYF